MSTDDPQYQPATSTSDAMTVDSSASALEPWRAWGASVFTPVVETWDKFGPPPPNSASTKPPEASDFEFARLMATLQRHADSFTRPAFMPSLPSFSALPSAVAQSSDVLPYALMGVGALGLLVAVLIPETSGAKR